MSPIPRYRQLAAILRAAIEAGHYPPGSRLPSEKTLTQTPGVARETASKAMDALADEGLAVIVPGVGWQVPPPEGMGKPGEVQVQWPIPVLRPPPGPPTQPGRVRRRSPTPSRQSAHAPIPALSTGVEGGLHRRRRHVELGHRHLLVALARWVSHRPVRPDGGSWDDYLRSRCQRPGSNSAGRISATTGSASRSEPPGLATACST
ncbi:GntR family transcriptional regulator [Micromonospora sp. WMMD1102]|uniref:GntR family transcriptional regulator n=1 Tax=Micromonospora sp. WMMD1102 TaxID=3016105 RepID=UPI00241550E3|nr:GntR family transcriptional regulator [Micromonospora sp. WMMD1102]MDG4789655.1 GntR family transcriptional regulator [Micromonospora sp. WMMD1102]